MLSFHSAAQRNMSFFGAQPPSKLLLDLTAVSSGLLGVLSTVFQDAYRYIEGESGQVKQYMTRS